MGRWIFFVMMASLCGGCCSFNREWKRVARQPPSTNEIAGRWTGQWRSDENGHHGKLRCLLTPHAPDAYMARFHARFWKIFTANYLVPLSATNINGEYKFSASANLGRLSGGTYSYDGSATATQFHSTYSSKYDHGVFEMRRPGPKE